MDNHKLLINTILMMTYLVVECSTPLKWNSSIGVYVIKWNLLIYYFLPILKKTQISMSGYFLVFCFQFYFTILLITQITKKCMKCLYITLKSNQSTLDWVFKIKIDITDSELCIIAKSVHSFSTTLESVTSILSENRVKIM
jgi:hypothetical protein